MTFENARPEHRATRGRRSRALVVGAAVTALLLVAGVVAARHGSDTGEPLMAGGGGTAMASATGTTRGTASPEAIAADTGTTEVPVGGSTTSVTSLAPTISMTAMPSTAARTATTGERPAPSLPGPSEPGPSVPESTTVAPRDEDVTIELRSATTNEARPSGSLVFDATVRNGSTAAVDLSRGDHCQPPDPVFELSSVPVFAASSPTIVEWDGNPDTLAAVLTPPVAQFHSSNIPLYEDTMMCGPRDYRALNPGETADFHFEWRLKMSPGPAPASIFARSILPREGPSWDGRGWLRTTVSSPTIELPYVDDPLRAKPFAAVVAAVFQHPAVSEWLGHQQQRPMWAQAAFFAGTWELRLSGAASPHALISDDEAMGMTVDAATLAVTLGPAPWN